MELGRLLRTLWQRRRMVALGALVALGAALLSIYRVTLLPPGVEGRTNVFATATTQILIDTPDSALADLAADLEPLESRASVFARFLTTTAAVETITRKAGLPPDSVEAQGPYDINLPIFQQEPTSEKRSSQIIGEGALYRLRFENNPSVPIISVFSQAPSSESALALASAAPAALREYIDRLHEEQHTPPSRQVEIRQLGETTGGVVNEGANVQIGTLVFVAVLVGWCMLLIPARTIAQGWRDAGERSEDGVSRERSGNGHDPDSHGASTGTPGLWG